MADWSYLAGRKAVEKTLEEGVDEATVDSLRTGQTRTKDLDRLAPLSEFADGGDGTQANPWTNAVSNAYSEMQQSGEWRPLLVQKGYFEESSKITHTETEPGRHLSLIGFAFWDSNIEIADGYNGTLLEVADGASAYIEGVRLSGNRQNQTEQHPLLWFRETKDCTIKDTFITQSSGAGVKLGEDNGDGTYKNSWTTEIINSPIEYCDGPGIDAVRASNSNVIDSTLSHNDGVVARLERFQGSFRGNRIRAEFNDAIQFVGNTTDTVRFVDNHIIGDDTQHAAFYFDPDGSQYPKNVIIENNTFERTVTAFDTNDYLPLGNRIVGNYFGDSVEVNLKNNNWMWDSHIEDNDGFNPVGRHNRCFIEQGGALGNRITFGSDEFSSYETPSANTSYAVNCTEVRLISTGGTGVSITIQDNQGNTVGSGLSTYDGRLPWGWTIDFGDFSDPPNVDVYFM